LKLDITNDREQLEHWKTSSSLSGWPHSGFEVGFWLLLPTATCTGSSVLIAEFPGDQDPSRITLSNLNNVRTFVFETLFREMMLVQLETPGKANIDRMMVMIDGCDDEGELGRMKTIKGPIC
jgi:hypothetical protein